MGHRVLPATLQKGMRAGDVPPALAESISFEDLPNYWNAKVLSRFE
jgi:hypothetical protein